MKSLILLFFSSLIISQVAFAADPIGTVAIVDGEVWILKEGKDSKKIAVKNNDEIYDKDTVITGEDGFVKILMRDDTIFDLGETTKFSFTSFKLKTPKDRKAKYDFEYGKMRSIFTIKAKNEKDLQIKTPDVVMGVRGTEILADVYQAGDKLKTNIALVTGKLNISMMDINKKLKEINIRPGVMFDSEKAIKNSMEKSTIKLKSNQMAMLKNDNRMKKGSFLFDTVNNKKSLPINKQMKSILKKVKGKSQNQDSNKEMRGGSNKPKNDNSNSLSPRQRSEFNKNMKKKIFKKMKSSRDQRRESRRRKRRRHSDLHQYNPPTTTTPPSNFGGSEDNTPSTIPTEIPGT